MSPDAFSLYHFLCCFEDFLAKQHSELALDFYDVEHFFTDCLVGDKTSLSDADDVLTDKGLIFFNDFRGKSNPVFWLFFIGSETRFFVLNGNNF